VVADDAGGRGAGQSVVARIVASHAADERTLDAAFGGCRISGAKQRERARGGEAEKNSFHGGFSM
jgi:hypothetical protein